MAEPAADSQKKQPILALNNVEVIYDDVILVLKGMSMEVHEGQIVALLGANGAGKSTLLRCASGLMQPTAGSVRFDTRVDGLQDIYALSEAERRMLMRTDWGIIFQNARDGLRMNVSAGANVGERLMAVGERNYGAIRDVPSE